MKQIFISGRMLEYLNRTIVTLILKCGNPESFNHYRPISLCNIVYKIVSKIIVARIRPLLPNLVSPLQTAFVPGRKGVDNAIIVQEVIHSMSKARGRCGYMAIKIDLEKTYDRMEWSFIRDTLNLFRFPSQLVSLIMSFVSTSSISVLFNGGALEPFSLPKVLGKVTRCPRIFLFCV